MLRKVFIIHSSEIIRKGLLAVIRSYFNCEIILMDKPELLGSYTVKGSIEAIILADEKFYAEVQAKKNSWQLRINLVFQIVSANTLGENQIGIFQSTEEIFHRLKKCETGKTKNTLNEEAELSIREKEVLKQVALGLSNKEIAEKLFISIHTVISHRKNITEKLGVKSISGLTVYAVMNNLLDTSQINPGDLI